MADRQRMYVVSVDTIGIIETYEVKAKSFKEAKEKAKDLFIKEYWKRPLLKATIEESIPIY